MDSKNTVLVFSRGDQLFQQLLLSNTDENSQAEYHYILVKPGPTFRVLGQDIYQIRPEKPEDYRELWKVLSDTKHNIAHIVHLWSYDSDPVDLIYHGNIENCLYELENSARYGVGALACIRNMLQTQDLQHAVTVEHVYYGEELTTQPQHIMASGVWTQSNGSDLSENHSIFFRSRRLKSKMSDLKKLSQWLSALFNSKDAALSIDFAHDV